ncbi:AAA family ATPase [Gordonia amarae]|uniref:Uncharacterized protein n=2 Tax=Gordonia amarae TaxID=36821 RepID=G7GSW9_9ACTN|nr:AAA family ATPase [Gordonia amarae]MCS3880836.1 hypothetical protein [Gordonia amarae]QHN32486.1 AAA family ATPase [Gordonia amarae]QHN41234.1 AAA family ATPase [Gordonia amarae]GAB06694.1 hypothetical protein GOAMR_58_00700 [Gordonia amarae NBRC 15530]
MLNPKIARAKSHLNKIWGRTKGYAFLEFKHKDDPEGKRWIIKKFQWPAEKAQVISTLEQYAPDHHCFYCPNVMRTDKRSLGNAVKRPWAWLDQDSPVVDASFFEEFPPTITIQSGTPGHTQRFWRVDLESSEQLHEVCKGIGETVGCGNDKKADNDLFRVPGTFNFKHAKPPMVEVIERRPTVRCDVAALYAAVSAQDHVRTRQSASHAIDAQKPAQVPRKASKLGRALRDTVTGDGTGRGKRTYATVALCVEEGYSLPETLWLMDSYEPGLDKYDRYPGGLPKQIGVCYDTKLQKDTTPANEDDISGDMEDEEYIVESADEGEMTLQRWLWQDWLPLGDLSLIAGYEESMKSSVCLWASAEVTRGRFDGEYRGQAKGVLYIAAEDSWESTIKPRLVANGADMSKVFRFRPPGSRRAYVNVVKSLELIRKIIREKNIGLIVLDPISGVLGDTNVEKEEPLRDALIPIIDMAEDTGVALLGIKHFTKLESTDPAKLMGGNRAWSYIARATIMVVADPNNTDDEARIIEVHKSNLVRKPKPQRFKPQLHTLRIEGQEVGIPAVCWEGESDIGVEEALRIALGRKRAQERGQESSKPKRPKAQDWLHAFLLDNGPTKRTEVIDSHTEIMEEQEFTPYSESTLDRAWKALGDLGFHGQARRTSDGEAIWSVLGRDGDVEMAG